MNIVVTGCGAMNAVSAGSGKATNADFSVALAEIWAVLGVTNQTDAMTKLATLALPGEAPSQESELADLKEKFRWLENEAKNSRTGISFDWVPSVEGQPSGWRFMRQHFIGDAGKSLVSAISKAQRSLDGVRRN